MQNLTKLPALNGTTYADLPPAGPFPSQLNFDRQVLSCTKFLRGTTEEAVLRVYEDLNCGAECLNKQQVCPGVEVDGSCPSVCPDRNLHCCPCTTSIVLVLVLCST